MEPNIWVSGNSVKIGRWKAEYTDRRTGREAVDYFTTQEIAQRYVAHRGVHGQGTVSEVDVANVAWMEGLEVENFDQAVAIYEMGQAAYEAQRAAEAKKSPEQLRADLDYFSIVTGVELV